ncbi:MAG: DUF4214 domain-containing protein, partial [Sulfitobacter sp.]|nr:DUF4214 domain-containing protein [Sulfitobacter sp.]
GEPRPGQSLTALITDLADPDGIDSAIFSYQWLRDGTAIPGARAQTYLVAQEDEAHLLSVEVSFTDDLDGAETLFSDQRDVGPGGHLFNGTPSDDTFVGTAGNDTILGGSGTDRAVIAGDQARFTLSLSPERTLLEDRRTFQESGQGTDLIASVELLQFADTTLNLDIFDGPTGLTAAEFGAIIELYIAYYNRAPDALGLNYWGTEFSNGFTLPQMAENFFGQPETRASYADILNGEGSLNTNDGQQVDAFVNQVYHNVLGRTPDPAGFAYWTDQLQNNDLITPDIFILAVIGGAKYPGDPTPQSYVDQAYLKTKSDLGTYFSVIKGMSDTEDAATSLALFTGSDESRTASRAAMDAHFADALDPDAGDFLMPLIGVIDDPFGLA